MGLRKPRRVRQSLNDRSEQGEEALAARLRGIRPVNANDRRIIRRAARRHPEGVPENVLRELAVGEYY